jgi:hypothetical protein
VNPDEDPPPDAENPRFAAEGSEEETFRLINTSRSSGMQAQRSGCADPHLEAYFPFIERVHIRSGCGPISGHFLNVAARSYSQFCQSCDGFYRRACWRAVSASLQWLAQRSKRN